jgi:plasmid maintenance system antidote protein VapI
MLPRNRPPTGPGEILEEEFLKPMNLTQVELAKRMGVPIQRVNTVVTGKRAVTPETSPSFPCLRNVPGVLDEPTDEL